MSFKFVRFEMKEGFDKEIDSLLRRQARGAAAARGDGTRSQGAASHLDADELSAFAEGALPAAARGAAVSHLAECDECRGIAVSLARASGFEVASEKVAVAAAAAAPAAAAPGVAGWRVWLSSLFAPRVLRYAVPVLALSLVGVVSFVALRSSRQGAAPDASQVARTTGRQAESQQAPAGAAAPATSTGTTAANANANTDGLVARATEEGSIGRITSSAPAPVAQPGAGEGRPAAPPPAPDGSTAEQPAPPPATERTEAAADAPASKAGPAEEREADKKAAENSPPKPDENKSKSAPEPVEVVSNEQYAQKRAQSRVAEVQMPDGSRNRAGSNQTNIAGGALSARPAPKAEDRDSGSASRGAAARSARKTESSGGRSDDEAERVAETRSAAGHRFRREGSAWVDVKYKPSMDSTGVRRGTEAYRALVADIPEIGRVAEQISGEVIVVVRGRAYRIR